MKNLFELERSSKLKYKPSKEEKKAQQEYMIAKKKQKAKEEYEAARKKRKPICRVMPFIVADNFDKFSEIHQNNTVYDIEAEYQRTKARLIS